jgi:hypothetical protein
MITFIIVISLYLMIVMFKFFLKAMFYVSALAIGAMALFIGIIIDFIVGLFKQKSF